MDWELFLASLLELGLVMVSQKIMRNVRYSYVTCIGT
jgi:hypothetical protein